MWCTHLLRLSLSCLIERWTWWDLCADQQAIIITNYNSHTPLMKSDCPPLAVDHVQKGQAFSTKNLFQPTGHREFILLSEPKRKCYIIKWYSWRREGCVVSIKQPPLGLIILQELTLPQMFVCLQLCIAVYMYDVSVEANKLYTPTVVFVHKEIMCAFLLQSTWFNYVQKQWKQA